METHAVAIPEPEPVAVWRPPAIDVPTADLPLITRVERLAAPLRQATAELARRLDGPSIAAISRHLAAPDPYLDDRDESAGRRERSARAALAAWVVARLHRDTAGPDASRSIAAASTWFWGVRTPIPDPDSLVSVRTAIDDGGASESEALLPYLLDPFGFTTRRAMLSGAGNTDERKARKRAGTFYTPGDVARLLAGETVVDARTTMIDPACGAGVFLRAAFTRLCCDLGVSPRTAVERLYGVDIDSRAIDACAFMLAYDWLARDTDTAPGAAGTRWRLVRLNLAIANSLAVFSDRMSLDAESQVAGDERVAFRRELRRRIAAGNLGRPTSVTNAPGLSVWGRFPERSQERFGCVLMNPPFASAGKLVTNCELVSSYRTLAAVKNPGGVNLAWPFVEIAMRSVGIRGRAGLVLPLSLAYRSDPATSALRSSMTNAASWQLRFYDRAPDAVFGDDVKQRICLATMSKTKPRSVATSRLIRWSSAHRSGVFRSGVVTLHTRSMADGAPFLKIGTDLEARALGQLNRSHERLGASVARANLMHPLELSTVTGSALAVAPTAYNWIGVYRDIQFAQRGRKAASGKVSILVFDEDGRADAAYGLIASRVFLWWWRTTGDVFHIPLRMLTAAPFPLHHADSDAVEMLAAAGRAAWACARENPVRSTNRGVDVIAYTPPLASDELDAADSAVARAFCLRPEFVRFVQQDARRLVDAGRGA